MRAPPRPVVPLGDRRVGEQDRRENPAFHREPLASSRVETRAGGELDRASVARGKQKSTAHFSRLETNATEQHALVRSSHVAGIALGRPPRDEARGRLYAVVLRRWLRL